MHRIALAAPPKRPPPSLEITQPVAIKSAKVLSLLLILEALRQSPFAMDTQKV